MPTPSHGMDAGDRVGCRNLHRSFYAPTSDQDIKRKEGGECIIINADLSRIRTHPVDHLRYHAQRHTHYSHQQLFPGRKYHNDLFTAPL